MTPRTIAFLKLMRFYVQSGQWVYHINSEGCSARGLSIGSVNLKIRNSAGVEAGLSGGAWMSQQMSGGKSIAHCIPAVALLSTMG